MNHKEARLKILNELHSICFEDGCLRPLVTCDALKNIFSNEDSDKIYPDLKYLESENLIRGDLIGWEYPSNIHITESGIDEIESNNTELQKRHWATRFKILEWLYHQYFDNKYYTRPKEIADAIGLGDPKDPEFQMELVYLHEKGILECTLGGGSAGILDVQVTSIGFIESFIEDSIEEMKDSGESKIKLAVEKLEAENNDKSRASLFFSYLGKSQQMFEIALKVIQLGRDFVTI